MLLRTERRATRLGLSSYAALALSLALSLALGCRAGLTPCCCSTRRLALRSGTGPTLLLRLLTLGRLSARLLLCCNTGRALALCGGTRPILLLRLLTMARLSAGRRFSPPTFRSARLFAVALPLSDGLIFLDLAALGLAAIDLSLAPAFGTTAFSQSLSSALGLQSLATLSPRRRWRHFASRGASGRPRRHPAFTSPAHAAAGPYALSRTLR